MNLLEKSIFRTKKLIMFDIKKRGTLTASAKTKDIEDVSLKDKEQNQKPKF